MTGLLAACSLTRKPEPKTVIDNLFVPGDFASGRFINSGDVKEQVINDLGWAVSSGYTAGHAAVDFLNQ